MTKEENRPISSEEIKKMAQSVLDGTDPLMKAIEDERKHTAEQLREWNDLNEGLLAEREAKKLSYRAGRALGNLFKK